MVRGKAGPDLKELLCLAKVHGLCPVSKLNFSFLIFKMEVVVIVLLWGGCKKVK